MRYTECMADTDIYIKQIDTIGKNSIWLVDGGYIRKNINEDFVGFDHHGRFSFIPLHEFWIDKETNPEEHQFFIDHLLVEQRLMSAGVSYQEAYERANRAEKRERQRTELSKELKKLPPEEQIQKIHKNLLQKYSSKVYVWIVDGMTVRNLYLPEYTEGGHDIVYPFIPDHEIWIDEVISEQEQKFIILHELHERYLMAQGKKYLEAHKDATIVEDYCRDHPDGIEEKIKEEMGKNDKLK